MGLISYLFVRKCLFRLLLAVGVFVICDFTSRVVFNSLFHFLSVKITIPAIYTRLKSGRVSLYKVTVTPVDGHYGSFSCSVDIFCNPKRWWRTGRGLFNIVIKHGRLLIRDHREASAWGDTIQKCIELKGSGSVYHLLRTIWVSNCSWQVATERGDSTGLLKSMYLDFYTHPKRIVCNLKSGHVNIGDKRLIAETKGSVIYIDPADAVCPQVMLSQKLTLSSGDRASQYSIVGSSDCVDTSLFIKGINNNDVSLTIKKIKSDVQIEGACNSLFLKDLGLHRWDGKRFYMGGIACMDSLATCSGELQIKEITSIGDDPARLSAKWSIEKGKCTTDFVTKNPTVGLIHSSVTLDPRAGQFEVQVSNLEVLKYGDREVVFVLPQDLVINAKSDFWGTMTGSCKAIYQKRLFGVSKPGLATCYFDINKLSDVRLKASACGYAWNMYGSMDSGRFWLNHLSAFKGGIQHMLASPDGNTGNFLHGFCSYELCKDLPMSPLSRLLSGDQGRCSFTLNQANLPGVVNLDFNLQDSALLLKNGCNPLLGCSGHIDYSSIDRRLFCKDVLVQFAQGSCQIPSGIVEFDAKGETNWLSLPLCVNSWLYNDQSDFYGIATGLVKVQKRGSYPTSLEGTILLEHASYHGTGFEEDAKPSFLEIRKALSDGSALKINVALMTGKPLLVSNPFLDVRADLDVRVGGVFCAGRLRDPKISGSVNLQHGNFVLLDKPFGVESGKLTFLPHRSSDPFIDVVIKGRLKKFEVQFHVIGSAQSPLISASSYPRLREEQIFALVLSGSEHDSVASWIPSALINTFSKPQEQADVPSGRFSQVVRAMTKPLRKMNVSPYVADATKGHLGASVQVNLGERLHASLRKGLGGDDDLAVRMEYAFTENLHLNAVRAEEGRLGGEVEMRFKF